MPYTGFMALDRHRIVRRRCERAITGGCPSSGWYYAIVRPSSLYAIGNELDQLLRRDWCLRDADPERLQGILDGGDDRRRSWDGADFARALGAERIERRRRFLVQRFDRGHFHRAGQQVVGECRGGGLSALIESHPFQDRVADAVGHAAADLAV